MAEPLVIQFGADTSRAQNAMASLAASIAGNMASIGVAMSGGAANSNAFGGSLGALQQNVTRAANAISGDVRNIASRTAAAATAEKATLEGVVRAFTASAAGSQTAQATVQAGLTGTSTAITTIAGQIPSLRTLLGAFIAFEAAKLVFESVAASIEAARKHIEEFIQIGRQAERAGVGADFFQRATLSAEKYGLTVEQVTQALNHARDAATVRIGEGRGASNTSTLSDRLDQNVRAGNLTAADRATVENATTQEAKIRAVLDLIDKLRAQSRDLAAFDLAGKVFGADFERQLRNGIDLTNELRNSLNSTSATVAGVRIVGEDEVERARQLDAKAKDIANTFATALAPIQRDISNAVLDTYQAFLSVEAAVARVVAVAVNLYTQVTNIVGQVRSLVGSIPVIGKLLTASNPITFLQEYGKATGVIPPEEAGPPAPLSVKVRPRGPDRSAALPSLGRGRSGSDSESLDGVETLINQLQKARDTAKAELENVEKTNVEREKAVALAKAEAVAREDVQKGRRDSAELTEDERSRVLAAAEAWQTYKDRTMDAQQAIRQAADAARFFGDAASTAFADAVLEGKSLNDVFSSLIKTIQRSALQAIFTGQGPLAGLFGTAATASSGDQVGGVAGLFTGLLKPAASSTSGGASLGGMGDLFASIFRANGGPVEAGRAYTIGERGREMFIPDRNGQIVPIAQGGNASAAPSINFITPPGVGLEPAGPPQRRADGGFDQVLRAVESGLGKRAYSSQGPFRGVAAGAGSRIG